VSITPDAQPGRPFNEHAALQELERLQRAIEETRRKRKETGEAFDAFVRSFQKERQEAALADATHVASAPVIPVVAPAPVMPVAPTPPQPPAIVEESEPVPVPAPLAALPVARRRARVAMVPAVAGAALAIIAAVVLIGRPWGAPPRASGIRGSGSVGSPAATDSQAANVAGGPRTPDPGSRVPSPAAAPAAGVNAELTAVRRVWVRIITDGNRVERELPAGTVVPLRAKATLTLRIGDAGAVKVIVNDRDQGPLGRDGEVVMRTFTAQTPAR
jgi:Domain of unknown function (DUF4115)